jgi:hypothetical protein
MATVAIDMRTICGIFTIIYFSSTMLNIYCVKILSEHFVAISGQLVRFMFLAQLQAIGRIADTLDSNFLLSYASLIFTNAKLSKKFKKITIATAGY